ncbi:MAG: tRNA uridine-5-carboxymethylaminomethyl(34) synthesis GTPase MnmE [Alphaproteobacteria bacterium]|jgi:tRNA modification GTPase|nr:tRNA uridine-5-carboxymethylaminomethyl(34) synthesis GTPase MnmE [Alphaproteobacteria bacterium]
MPEIETIFALSSGSVPAGIAIVRVSGPQAGPVLARLSGDLPPPRRASYRRLRDESGAPLDDALVLWFPGQKTATGEDLAEFHLHGGRAVVAAMLAELARQPGCRPAKAGEFTRRAFENGRIDLAEAEGLADLLAAETEAQRQSALVLAEGGLGQLVSTWERTLLAESARLEALLDFSDEGDVGETAPDLSGLVDLRNALKNLEQAPPAERLRDGVRVVLAGPPNSGKSSLFNYLVGREAAIVTPIAGTTRDRIEAPIALDGLPLLLIDTAGLRDETADEVEAIGIARSGAAMAEADILLWLGPAEAAPLNAMVIAARADVEPAGRPGLAVSTVTGMGLPALRESLVARAKAVLPRPGALALNARHRAILRDITAQLDEALGTDDLLIRAECLRLARAHMHALTGRAGVESLLDALFGTFCIGK